MQAIRKIGVPKAINPRLENLLFKRGLSTAGRIRINGRKASAPIKSFSISNSPTNSSMTRTYHASKRASNAASLKETHANIPTNQVPSRVPIQIDGQTVDYSAVLLRDSCQCPSCVHESTNQRLFSTGDIPVDIRARAVEIDEGLGAVNITWTTDASGYDEGHTTKMSVASLRQLRDSGSLSGSTTDTLRPQALWSQKALNLPDYDYDTYLKDDETLFKLLNQLRTDGLAYLTNVPGVTESLATIATRIGPVKDTFYDYTWDVRTVPSAINAAYTSSDLGFHTDLLYFQQPPHVQLLHCVQSASIGGASVFADAYRAAVDLFHMDIDAFDTLATIPVNYHYNHPDSNVYRTTKPVIDLKTLRIGNTVYTRVQDYINERHKLNVEKGGSETTEDILVSCMDKINWGPPFLAPFSNHEDPTHLEQPPLVALNSKVDRWHQAASKFNALLQRPELLHERKMNPGECVLFDNTRTLHSRRAFDMADVGKPRWLRGTYVDKDPYLSKVRVLQNKFGL